MFTNIHSWRFPNLIHKEDEIIPVFLIIIFVSFHIIAATLLSTASRINAFIEMPAFFANVAT